MFDLAIQPSWVRLTGTNCCYYLFLHVAQLGEHCVVPAHLLRPLCRLGAWIQAETSNAPKP